MIPAMSGNTGKHQFKILLLVSMFACMRIADAGEMMAPLPILQLNPLMMRYMGFTATDAFASAGQGHRISIQEHYANIYLTDHIFYPPSRYLIDMELSATRISWRSHIGRIGIHVTLPVLLPYGGFMDGFVNGFHRVFHFPNDERIYRPNNSYAYTLAGAWDSHPGVELGNISAGLQYPVLVDRNNALAILAGAKLPTASRQRGWGSGTWDAGIGLVDSVRIHQWFAHFEGWYFRPFGNDYISYLKNRPYARGSVAIGVKGRFFRMISDKVFSFIIQGQGGMSPYHVRINRNSTNPSDLYPWLAFNQNPWLVGVGLRWQDAKARDWQFTITENITQQSTQDFDFSLGCDFD